MAAGAGSHVATGVVTRRHTRVNGSLLIVPPENALQQVRVIEMTPTHEGGGVAVMLAHGTGLRHTGDPQEPALTPLGAGHQAVRPEQAAATAVRTGTSANPTRSRSTSVDFASRVAASDS